jgi:predicted enzyme related to lactoylglutathione lyase
MPIGNPQEENPVYVEGGKATRVWLTMLPVHDLEAAIRFYTCALGLELQLLARERNWAEVGPDEPLGKLALYVPEKGDVRQPGGPSQAVLATDSIFELHRRLVDEEIRFIMKPEKRPWGGLMAVFLDPDGNEITVVEDPEHYTRAPKPEQPLRPGRDERSGRCGMH